MNYLKANKKLFFPLLAVFSLLAVTVFAMAQFAMAQEGDKVDEKLAELTKQAKADLATKLAASKDGDAIELISARWVTWRDSSLGCPEEDMMYAQMLTDGALILLRAGDREYRYHSNKAGPPFHCENPTPNDPLPDDSMA